MATIKELLTNNQSITITLTSLANAAAQQSTAIDNTVNQDLDAGVMVKIKTNASGTSANGFVSVYAYGSADDGTTYSDTCTGSNGSVTLTAPPNVKLIGVINAVANSTTYISGPMSVAAAFGGYLPGKWGIVVVNSTGATLDASVGSAIFERIQGQSN